MKIRKRNGFTQDFSVNKTFRSLKKCDVPEQSLHNLAARVNNIITHQGQVSNMVDSQLIENIILQQLIAEGLHGSAKLFLDYKIQKHDIKNPIPDSKIAEDREHFKTDLQYYQLLSKYARWSTKHKRRETWAEVCERTVNWLMSQIPPEKYQPIAELLDRHLTDCVAYSSPEQRIRDTMFHYLFHMKAAPAMRVIQMAGPALDRCHVGVYNCAYLPICDLFSFAEMLYILMQGSGCGFSVEDCYVYNLPVIKSPTGVKHTHKINDSTEGWCDALYFSIQSWFNGEDVEFDFSGIRPEGSILKIKGGTASGPDPLKRLLNFCREKIYGKQVLHDIQVHDICCMIGDIVQVGGVRRSSEISLSELASERMRSAKSGNWYETAIHRSKANNSAVYNNKPDQATFLKEWLALMESKSGERGIFNREGILKNRPKRRDSAKFGSNPCGEINLRPHQFCNLSMAIARPEDTEESLGNKIVVATLFGTIQSLCTRFNYIRDDWAKNCIEERLLGVDITGQADCPLFNPENCKGLFSDLRDFSVIINEKLSEILEITPSKAVTTVKPGGNSAVLFNCSSGLSPRFSKYQIRNVRESRTSPIARLLIDEKVPHTVDPANHELLVFAFPIENPDSRTRNDWNAIQQLDYWLVNKKNYTEHNPSVSIYVDEDEWIQVAHWVYSNWDDVGGLAFFPKDNGIYKCAPNIEITQIEYLKLKADFPKIRWERLRFYETDGSAVAASKELACIGDQCEMS